MGLVVSYLSHAAGEFLVVGELLVSRGLSSCISPCV